MGAEKRSLRRDDSLADKPLDLTFRDKELRPDPDDGDLSPLDELIKISAAYAETGPGFGGSEEFYHDRPLFRIAMIRFRVSKLRLVISPRRRYEAHVRDRLATLAIPLWFKSFLMAQVMNRSISFLSSLFCMAILYIKLYVQYVKRFILYIKPS